VRNTSINNLNAVGLVKDMRPWQLPPEAWTILNNVRFRDEGIERLLGYEQVFGTPLDAPHFLMPVPSNVQLWWLYMSLTKAYAYDGTDHAEITRASGDYTATETRQLNGTMLGGIPILNNGVDVPQYWASYALTTQLADLPDWPATLRAKIMRSLGPFLMMFNVTLDGDNFPHRIRWAHPADPGSVPSSYAVDDPNFDGGEFELSDANAGVILDAQPLNGEMFVYKESSTHRLRYIGGQNIFSDDTFLESVGLLAPRCVALTDDGLKHVILTQDDVVVHDGNTSWGLLDRRLRKTLFNALDTDNYHNSFVFSNPLFKEIWICYPESGMEHPNRALIWNYSRDMQLGAFSEADVDFRNVDIGNIQGAGDGTWDADTGTWDGDTSPWERSNRRKLVACKTSDEKFVQLDSGNTRDGASFGWTVQREALGIFGETRERVPITDFTTYKQFDRVWPKTEGAACNVRVGFRDKIGEATAWESPMEYDPALHNYVDAEGSGRVISIEYSSLSDDPWRIDGYDVQMEQVSEF